MTKEFGSATTSILMKRKAQEISTKPFTLSMQRRLAFGIS